MQNRWRSQDLGGRPSCCRRVAESLRILLPKLLPPLVSSNPSWSQSGTASLRKQLKCDLVSWPDHAEVATIEGRDSGGVEPFGPQQSPRASTVPIRDEAVHEALD